MDVPAGSSENRYWVVGRSCTQVQFKDILNPTDAVAFLSSPGVSEESTANRYVLQGIVHLVNQRSGPAIANFTEALRIDPQNEDAYYYRGLAYCHRFLPHLSASAATDPSPDQQRALGDLTEAIRLDPDAVRHYLARAEVYRSMGWTEQADSDNETVLVKDPNNLIALGNYLPTFGLVEQINLAELDRARSRADRARSDADRARSNADKARSDADKARSDADKARSDADKARSDSDKARSDADKARSDADKARSDADIARNQAVIVAKNKDTDLANASAALEEANARIEEFRSRAQQSRAKAVEATARAELHQAQARKAEIEVDRARKNAKTVPGQQPGQQAQPANP
jgi:tetratricopeptide (TPR) repeat protein